MKNSVCSRNMDALSSLRHTLINMQVCVCGKCCVVR